MMYQVDRFAPISWPNQQGKMRKVGSEFRAHIPEPIRDGYASWWEGDALYTAIEMLSYATERRAGRATA